jgi:hypothetical protein
VYTSGAAIVAGAPVTLSSGLVVELTDDDAGASGVILGFAQNAASASGEDVLVALAYPGRKFVGSLTDIAASVASDGGTKALAVSDQSATPVEFHKDDTTLKWVLGASGGANASAVVMKLIDPVGSTTDDDISFGSANTGKALVEFVVEIADTIFG